MAEFVARGKRHVRIQFSVAEQKAPNSDHGARGSCRRRRSDKSYLRMLNNPGAIPPTDRVLSLFAEKKGCAGSRIINRAPNLQLLGKLPDFRRGFSACVRAYVTRCTLLRLAPERRRRIDVFNSSTVRLVITRFCSLTPRVRKRITSMPRDEGFVLLVDRVLCRIARLPRIVALFSSGVPCLRSFSANLDDRAKDGQEKWPCREDQEASRIVPHRGSLPAVVVDEKYVQVPTSCCFSDFC